MTVCIYIQILVLLFRFDDVLLEKKNYKEQKLAFDGSRF